LALPGRRSLIPVMFAGLATTAVWHVRWTCRPFCTVVAIAVGAYTDRYIMHVTNFPIGTCSGWYSIEGGVHTRFGRHMPGFMFVVGKGEPFGSIALLGLALGGEGSAVFISFSPHV
jgi:hypothetical protein